MPYRLGVPAWTPEVEVDGDLARRLLAQFPRLRGLPVRRLSEGWDRSVWLVGDADDGWVAGFPRRESVLPGFRLEIAWLPRLAPLLPAPVPVPELVGAPADGFPWPFWAARHLPGRESCDAALGPAGRRAVALDLARFLRRLHSPEVAAAVPPDALPVDGNGRSDMGRRVPLARAQLEEVRVAGLWEPPPSAAAVLRAAEALPPVPYGDPARLPVVHGDLHLRHALVAGAGAGARLSGVIDWVDLCRADPCVDLLAYWGSVAPADRPAFLAAYGPVSEEQLLRARVLSLSVNAALAAYAAAEGMATLRTAAVDALARTVTDRDRPHATSDHPVRQD